MNKIIIAAIAATALIATPALARTNDGFVGPRAEVTVGANDITNSPDRNDVTYGAAIGVDAPVGDRFTIGIEANSTNFAQRERQIGAAARVGYVFTPKVLGYVKGGYNNYQNVFSQKLDGAVVGAGVEYKFSKHFYGKAQYDYSDFENGVGSHAVSTGIGIRF